MSVCRGRSPCGFCTQACYAWLGAILANAVSILVGHIKKIYVVLASAKSADMLCLWSFISYYAFR